MSIGDSGGPLLCCFHPYGPASLRNMGNKTAFLRDFTDLRLDRSLSGYFRSLLELAIIHACVDYRFFTQQSYQTTVA